MIAPELASAAHPVQTGQKTRAEGKIMTRTPLTRRLVLGGLASGLTGVLAAPALHAAPAPTVLA